MSGFWQIRFRRPRILARARRFWSSLRQPPLEQLVKKLTALARRGEPARAAVDKLSERQLDRLVRRDAGRSIATLHRALRELRQVDEELLAALEGKLGARRILDLILEAGTLVELLRLARHSTPATARRLISLLSTADIERLHRRTAASEHSIGTFGAALQGLERADEALLATFEEKVGERRYLDLILATGTIFQLLRFLGYPRPQTARRLVAALKAADIERLLARTVERRSLGILELALRELALIDEQLVMALIEKIGVRRWWRLILANGNISVLSGVVRWSGWDLGDQLFATFAAAPTAELEPWLLRSDLFHVCRLLRWRTGQLESVVSKQLFDRLRPVLAELLERADWPIRARAAYQLAHAPQLPLTNAMTALVWDRLEAVEPPIPGTETVRIFLHCARYLVSADPYLADRGPALVERHLGPPDGWPQTPGFLLWARHLLRMACEPEMDEATARRWLSVACRAEVAPLFAEADSLEVLFYIWNLYALWFQWREDAAEELREVVAEELGAAAIGAFNDRAEEAVEGDEQRIRLALAGVLTFSSLASADIAASDPDLWTQPEHLAPLLEEVTFVPSALAVLGCEALAGRRCSEELRREVGARLDDSATPSAAMRFLQLWMRI